jgi:DNA-binding CsgD family transcriptional regulator
MGVTALASDMAAGMRCEALVGRDDELALINRFLEHLVEGDSVDSACRVASAAYVGANVTGDLPNADALRTRAHGTDTEGSGSLEAASAAALMLLVTDGDIDAAGRLLRQAIEPAIEGHDEPICGDAVRTLAHICVSGARADLWEALGRLIDCCSDRIPPAAVMHATIALDPVRCPAPVLGALDADIRGLAHVADSAAVVRIAGASVFVDRLPSCRPALQRIASDEPAAGALTAVIQAETLLALEAFQTGQWDEAERFAEIAEALGLRHGFGLLRFQARAVRAFVAAGRGDERFARSLADEMLRWAIPRGVGHVCADAHYAAVLVALANAEFDTAFRLAERISPAGTLARHQPRAAWVMLDLVEAALRIGRIAEANAHVEAIKASGVAEISSRTALLAGGAIALVAPEEAAPDLFARALATPGAERWPFERARVALLCGERLRRARESVRSREHLAAALESFERLGAGPWADRAGKELRATGQARPRRESYDRDALTPQEHEIAGLAAAGMTNKQIGQRLYLSHRTIGAHLYRIFPKLGITTRAALRDALSATADIADRASA